VPRAFFLCPLRDAVPFASHSAILSPAHSVSVKAELIRPPEEDTKMREQIAVVMCSMVLGLMMLPSAAIAQQKTAKECREEWRANKAANQANGVTEKAYVAQCRGSAAPAQPTAAPAPPAPAPVPTAAPAAPSPNPTATTPPSKPAPSSANPVGANEFSTEAQAKAHCPSDIVVWANLTSKIYHFSGARSYGATKHGAYMCERDTAAAGMRAAKNETHPKE
jgi:hypothetical protein